MMTSSLAAITRRASLVGVGLLALGAPLATEAKGNSKKKLKKKQRKKCQSQVAQCEAEVIELCEGNQDCLDTQLPCCAELAACDLLALFTCIANAP